MTNNQLKEQLLERFKYDQRIIARSRKNKVEKVCHENTTWFKQIIEQYGWPDETTVGEDGENAAWLLIQHADDITLQECCLELLKKLPQTRKRKGHIAYLVDRILTKKGQMQIYGTQFAGGEPLPILDPNKLNKRRKDMSLEDFQKYYRRMKKQFEPVL